VDRGAQRDARPRHLGELVGPQPRSDDDLVGLDRAAVGLDGLNLAAADLQVQHLRVGEDLVLVGVLLGPLTHYLAGPQRVTGPRVGLVQPALDHLLVDERDLLLDLLGADNFALLPPGFGAAELAFHLLEPFVGPGDLDALAERELVHLVVLCDGVVGEQRHLLVVLQGHQEVRGVSRRATRVRQRPLVDLDDVLATEFREVIDETVADNTRT